MIRYRQSKTYNKGMKKTEILNDLEKISIFSLDFGKEKKMTRKSQAYWMNINPTDTEHFGYLGRVPTVTKKTMDNTARQLKRARQLTAENYRKNFSKNPNATFDNKRSLIIIEASNSQKANFKKAMKQGELAYKEALLQG